MNRVARLAAAFGFVAIILSTGAASAQHPAALDNEISVHLGGAIGLTDWTPGGFKMETEYGRRLNRHLWFDAQLNFVVGDQGPRWNDYYDCRDYANGSDLELIAGVKFKFPSRALVPYGKIGAGLAFSWCHSMNIGTALVARGGGGLKYFVLPQLGIGGEMNLMLGPHFTRDWTGDNVALFLALDIMVGVEFLF
jgi:hypothetical protein